MANANASRPGVGTRSAQSPKQIQDSKPDSNIQLGVEIVQRPDGSYVERTVYSTGTIVDTNVFPGDYDGSKDVTKELVMTPELLAKAIAEGVAAHMATLEAAKVPAKATKAKE